MHKVTGDITQMAAQVPALFEALSGMRISELFAKIRTIGDSAKRTVEVPDPDKAPGENR
jgi:flotillin